mgnify:CR=1 FL=1
MALAIKDYEKMLTLLDISTLKAIHIRSLDNHYGWGHQPLLKYSVEALKEYASVIYRLILPHLSLEEITEEEYIAKWLAPYTKVQEQLSIKADDYIGLLKDIANNPIIEPSIIVELEYDIYTQIRGFLSGNYAYYPSLNDFLCCRTSPLRGSLVSDSRIFALVSEVDTLLNACNTELDEFIGVQFDYTWQTGKIIEPDGKDVSRERFREYSPKGTYGSELKSLRQRILDRLAFYKLEPATIETLKVNKSKIPLEDWKIISQAFDDKVITSKVRKIISSSLKVIAGEVVDNSESYKSTLACATVSADIDKNSNLVSYLRYQGFKLKSDNVIDAFIRYFTGQIESAYNTLLPITIYEYEDYADSIAVYRTDHTAEREEILKQLRQANLTVHYFDDYNFSDIKEHFVNNLTLIFADQTIDAPIHGALKGIYKFAAKLYKYITSVNTFIFDFTALARELRILIQYYTILNGDVEGILQFGGTITLSKGQYKKYADERFSAKSPIEQRYHTILYGITKVVSPLPVPKAQQISKEQILDNCSKVLIPTATLPCKFDLTPSIQKVLDNINASAVITVTSEVVLSDAEIQSLVPIQDYTLKQIANMITGRPCTPYILELTGCLIIRITDTGHHIKVVPTIRDDKYADYHFVVYNWDTLNNHIYKLKQILSNTSEYLEWQGVHGEINYRPLPKQADLRKAACEGAKDYFDILLSMANNVFRDDKIMQTNLREIANAYFYKNIYLSAHRLAAWVYYTEEYQEKISSKPVDDTGKRILFEPNHKDMCRHNNAKDNLKIELRSTNAALRSTSIPVEYNGKSYLILKKYCEETGAGNYKNLQQKVGKLKAGQSVTYKRRVYTRVDNKGNLLIVSDLEGAD